jgi:hypothetical protein
MVEALAKDLSQMSFRPLDESAHDPIWTGIHAGHQPQLSLWRERGLTQPLR